MAVELVLTFWVIYERPRDFPFFYVVRCQHLLSDGRIAIDHRAQLAGNLEDARRLLPHGLTLADAGDPDPAIREVWF